MFIKDFNVLKNLDVNFSHRGEHQFNYVNGAIKVSPNTKPVLDFGNAISSMTAIAGENGAGKSSLFEQILAAMATLRNGSLGYNSWFKGIVCFGNYIFIHQERTVKNRMSLKRMGYKLVDFAESPFENQMSHSSVGFYKTAFVYFSNAIDWRSTIDEHNLYNISTQYLLNKDYKFGLAPVNAGGDAYVNVALQHFYEDSFRCTHFYVNFPNFLPVAAETFGMQISRPHQYLKWLFGDDSVTYDFAADQITILQNVDGSADSRFADQSFYFQRKKLTRIIAYNYRLSLISKYCAARSNGPQDRSVIRKFIFYNDLSDNFFETDRDFFLEAQSCLTSLLAGSRIMNKGIRQEVTSVYGMDWRDVISRYFYCDNTAPIRALIKKMMDLESQLLRNDYLNNRRVFQYTMIPHLSAGQHSLLCFFSRIYFAIRHFQTLNEGTEAVIILIDEADVFFHPAWKRRMVQWLVNFFNMEFNRLTVQILVSSHSPFLLSDMTSNEVILMQRDGDRAVILPKDKYRIFAGNIHELLADTFFLEEGTVGEFAVGILEKLVSELSIHSKTKNSKGMINSEVNNSASDKDASAALIDCVADPIIRERLKDLWSEKYAQDLLPSINEERESLLKRLRDLENISKK